MYAIGPSYRLRPALTAIFSSTVTYRRGVVDADGHGGAHPEDRF